MLRAEGLPELTEVALTFVEPPEMISLNESHMGRSGPTDVLAFPVEALTPGQTLNHDESGPPLMIGDVVVCPQVVRDQAIAADVRFDDEMALMVVHGVLHLLGYDHVVDSDAEVMEHRERDLLALAGRQRP